MASSTEYSSRSSGLSLALRLQDGSGEAWREFVELYGPLVESWSARAGLPRAAREDIAQEVFLAVHRSIDRFDPSRPNATFRGWLWRITRNAVLQSLRKSEPQPPGGSTANAQLAEIADPWPDASEWDPPGNASDTSLLLRRAMEQIKPRLESQTWLAFWNTTVLGQATAEVAKSLGISPAAVRKAKSRTLQRLRQQLGDQV